MKSQNNLCRACGAKLPPGLGDSSCPACLLKRGLESNTLASGESQSQPPQWNPPPPEQLANQFNELEITELIGRGGMGAVYKARQKSLNRIVALKILPPEIGHNPDFARHFASEAQAMARLNHPHIVSIYDFGQVGGLFYFLMEFVDGPSLRHILNRGGVTPDEALAIVPQICEALQFAHDHGIVHRDIKPENILMNRQGQVKIADFGLAKLIGQDGSTFGEANPGATREPGKIVGTPRYMAPEQKTRSDSVDHRADIYSLGVVFYQLLTGELPGREIIPPSQKIAIDVRLDEIVLRTLEQEPDRRYQNASEIKTEVETVVDRRSQAAGTVPVLAEPPRPRQYPDAGTGGGNPSASPKRVGPGRWGWRLVILLAAAVALLTSALVLYFSGSSPNSASSPKDGRFKPPYNPFVTVGMVFSHQKAAVRLRYITTLTGGTDGGRMAFPVWDAKGKPVTRAGIHRFLLNKAVGHISYLEYRVRFLVFSVPAGVARDGFWYSMNSPHNTVMSLGTLNGFGPQFGGLFWFSEAVGIMNNRRLPARGDFRLRVAYGPWKVGKTHFPGPLTNFTTTTNNLNIIGFGSAQAGKSFADIVWLKSSFRKNDRILAAYTYNGARMLPIITTGSHPVGSNTRPERIEYSVPLSQIKYFRILSRPIHTIVFQNVALEASAPTALKASPAAYGGQ